MNNHTPGPWTIREGVTPITVVGANGEALYHESDKRLPSVIGDARLIAAAPELLEALEGLMGPVIFGSQTDREILCDWGTSGMEHVTRARAAIAKVKGEQI